MREDQKADEPSADGADQRSLREAQFHDQRFSSDGGKRRSTKFYRVAGPSRQELSTRVASIPAASRVLEIGCGPDSVAWGLAARGVDVTGIDISEEAIRLAHAEALHRDLATDRFIVMDAERLDFPDGSFDAVIGSSILHHLDIDRALDEIRRVLRPGGRGIFYEPLGHNPAINLYRRLTPGERSADEKALTGEELDALRRVFPHLDLEYFHLTSLLALPLLRSRAFDRVSSQLERVDRWMFRKVPATREYAWVLVIDGRLAVGRPDDLSPT